MSTTNTQNYLYVGSLITSVVGAAALILADFAGWDASNYYTGVQESGVLDVSLENLLVAPLFLAAAFLLLFCSYISVLGLRESIEDTYLQFGIFASIISIAIQAAIALLFIIIVLLEDIWWWFDFGFFGGVIGAMLTLIFLYLGLKESSS
ncbi:MAG: hypothetical protein ACFFAJ_16355 [Candidatus Hodarchaeota archaeon]